MRVWDNIKKWGRNLMQRASTATGAVRELKDVFEIAGMPASETMFQAFSVPTSTPERASTTMMAASAALRAQSCSPIRRP